MIATAYLCIAVTAFYFGFKIGQKKSALNNKKIAQRATVKLSNEYKNFLNYDGSEQL